MFIWFHITTSDKIHLKHDPFKPVSKLTVHIWSLQQRIFEMMKWRSYDLNWNHLKVVPSLPVLLFGTIRYDFQSFRNLLIDCVEEYLKKSRILCRMKSHVSFIEIQCVSVWNHQDYEWKQMITWKSGVLDHAWMWRESSRHPRLTKLGISGSKHGDSNPMMLPQIWASTFETGM